MTHVSPSLPPMSPDVLAASQQADVPCLDSPSRVGIWPAANGAPPPSQGRSLRCRDLSREDIVRSPTQSLQTASAHTSQTWWKIQSSPTWCVAHTTLTSTRGHSEGQCFFRDHHSCAASKRQKEKRKATNSTALSAHSAWTQCGICYSKRAASAHCKGKPSRPSLLPSARTGNDLRTRRGDGKQRLRRRKRPEKPLPVGRARHEPGIWHSATRAA
jgi:hypothetical protein